MHAFTPRDLLSRCAFPCSMAALMLALAVDVTAAQSAAESDPGTDPSRLAFNDAVELAVAMQPLLDAQRSTISGSRESAIASAQLPDPILVGGMADLPITGADRFSVRQDEQTQFMLGVKQVFPGGDKRQLRGARAVAEVARLDTDLRRQILTVQRESGLAWLIAWEVVQAQDLVRATIVEAQQQSAGVEINYRVGRAVQADLSGTLVTVALLEDQFAALQQQEWRARNALRRWIGDDADRPLGTSLPHWPEPDLSRLLQGLERHPGIAVQARAVDVATADLKLAKEESRPDWSMQFGYGYRPGFSDMASVQFETALPFFTAKRQDRVVQARAADVRSAELLWEDALREQRAAIQLGVTDWQRLRDRIRHFDDVIIPEAVKRMNAALAAYSAGGGSLQGVLEARRSLLDIRMQRLALRADSARTHVQLQYFLDAEQEGTQP